MILYSIYSILPLINLFGRLLPKTYWTKILTYRPDLTRTFEMDTKYCVTSLGIEQRYFFESENFKIPS